MALIAAVALAAGLTTIGGGGYILKRVIDRTEVAVEGVAGDLKEFIIKDIWPKVLSTLHILSTLLLMITISYCDTFLKDGPRAIYVLHNRHCLRGFYQTLRSSKSHI